MKLLDRIRGKAEPPQDRDRRLEREHEDVIVRAKMLRDELRVVQARIERMGHAG